MRTRIATLLASVLSTDRPAATASASIHAAENREDLVHQASFLAKSSFEERMRQQTDLWIPALGFESARVYSPGVYSVCYEQRF